MSDEIPNGPIARITPEEPAEEVSTADLPTVAKLEIAATKIEYEIPRVRFAGRLIGSGAGFPIYQAPEDLLVWCQQHPVADLSMSDAALTSLYPDFPGRNIYPMNQCQVPFGVFRKKGDAKFSAQGNCAFLFDELATMTIDAIYERLLGAVQEAINEL